MNSSERGPRGALLAGVFLLALGAAMRVYNAFAYNILWGFDARENWRYIELLTRSWALPAPDADWSTAHPPFFYYMSAGIVRLASQPDKDFNVILLRLVGSAVGLVMAALAVQLIRKLAPQEQRRALIAWGLLLFLPVHIYMSAMLSEEILVSTLISAVLVGVALDLYQPAAPATALRRAGLLGILAGLAFLTKLSGVLVIAAVVASYLIDGWRNEKLAERLRCAALFACVAGLVGGWYYVRNLISYGYLYPHGLEVHKVMFDMPPGVRGIGDYFNFPWVTFIDPQVMSPELLHSVWGTTYATIFFDAHRHFLPRELLSVNLAGMLILGLSLLPTAAFVAGAVRGARRALREPGGPDTLFLLLMALTLAGYTLFTWRNPWFPVVKGSFLLGLCIPFAYYASEVLSDWTRPWLRRSIVVWCALGVLVCAISISFSHSELLWSNDHMPQPGTAWWNTKLE